MRHFGQAAVALLLVLASIPSSKALAGEGAGSPPRIAWAGLDRGPVSPSEAQALEGSILEELSKYESFHLVDVTGNALGERALARDAARFGKLVDEGIGHLLKLDYKKAIARLDLAIALFEERLTSLRDHEMMQEALLAKANALLESGRKQAAKSVLSQLAALEPKRRPKSDVHKPVFVELYEQARGELGSRGVLEIKVDVPGARIRLDGADLGEAPLRTEPVLPGSHYVVALWRDLTVTEVVRIGPGQQKSVTLSRKGPADRLRTDLLEAFGLRKGESVAEETARKLVKIASSDGLLAGGIRASGGERRLVLVRHDGSGKVTVVGITKLAKGDEEAKASLRRVAAALFVDGREGRFEISPDGSLRTLEPREGDAYGRRKLPPGSKTELEAPEAPPTRTESQETSLTERWWFWGAIGAVAVAAGAGALVAFRPDAVSTEIRVSFPEPRP